MAWLQRNHYLKVLIIVSLIIIAYIFITDEGELTFEQITIKEGDTLWTLADRYKGNLTKEDWIRMVAVENNLDGEHIIAGETLMIPVPKDAIYIAINEEDEIQPVKVASKREWEIRRRLFMQE